MRSLCSFSNAKALYVSYCIAQRIRNDVDTCYLSGKESLAGWHWRRKSAHCMRRYHSLGRRRSNASHLRAFCVVSLRVLQFYVSWLGGKTDCKDRQSFHRKIKNCSSGFLSWASPRRPEATSLSVNTVRATAATIARKLEELHSDFLTSCLSSLATHRASNRPNVLLTAFAVISARERYSSSYWKYPFILPNIYVHFIIKT
jgi:hypothetical protein